MRVRRHIRPARGGRVKLVKANVYLAQVPGHTALGDVYEGFEAELGDHELLAREEFGGESEAESLFGKFTRQAKIAEFNRVEIPGDSVQDLRRHLEKKRPSLGGGHVARRICSLLRH
ncbi:hypothetical protein Trco_001526 [Trichoderma cornu-damae]|uniref:Uncharacterized protein n=1 Tax=Trichoderma cornu-damae TaxID=654480 RepID=A0A9P8QU21_9HYPO|nr:hypothetical protein Trco_001526 [Trichoderma cornu-damae]